MCGRGRALCRPGLARASGSAFTAHLRRKPTSKSQHSAVPATSSPNRVGSPLGNAPAWINSRPPIIAMAMPTVTAMSRRRKSPNAERWRGAGSVFTLAASDALGVLSRLPENIDRINAVRTPPTIDTISSVMMGICVDRSLVVPRRSI